MHNIKSVLLSFAPIYCHLLLPEIPPSLAINKHKIEIILNLQPIMYILIGGRQRHPDQKHPKLHNLPRHRTPICNLIPHQHLLLRRRPIQNLPPLNINIDLPNGQVHVVEGHLAQQTVLQVVVGLVVVELDVQALLDADLQGDRELEGVFGGQGG